MHHPFTFCIQLWWYSISYSNRALASLLKFLMILLASGVERTPGCYTGIEWYCITSEEKCTDNSIVNQQQTTPRPSQMSLYRGRHSILPVERDPWDPGSCWTAAEPTVYGPPLGASPGQWWGLVSASCRYERPFQCPGHSSAEFADTSHQCQGLGCPVCF